MALNFYGISIPIPSLPSLPKVSIPKIEVPKVSVPKVSIPKIEVPKISIPKVSIPAPKVSIPKIELPKLPGAGVGLPPIVSLPAAAAAGAADAVREKLPKVDLPKVKLPDVGKTAGAVSRGYDEVIKARDASYDAGIGNIAAGNVAKGGLQFGGTAAADVLLPMDLADAANKWATGRGDEIDSDLALWAAIDAVSLAAAPLTLGASYAAGRALKAGKVAAKTSKVGGEVAKSSAFGKLGGILTGADKTSGAAKAAPRVTSSSYLRAYQNRAKVAAESQQAYAKQFAKFQQQQQEMAARIRRQQAAISEQIAEMASKVKAPIKGLDTAADVAKAESRWSKTSGVLGKAGKATGLVGLGLGAGTIGLTMMGGAGAPAPAPEEDPYGPYDPNSGGGGGGLGDPIDWDSLLSGGLDYPMGDFQFSDGLGGYTDASGYYPAAYPDLLGLEGYGQDACEYLEDIPGVGGLYEGARRRGLGVPAVVGTIIVLVLVVAFLRSKKGKKMVNSAKKKVKGVAG